MNIEISTLISSVILSYFAITLITPLATRFGLVDIPKGRKQHSGSIPLIGGVSIFFAVLVSSLIFLPIENKLLSYLFCAAAIVTLGVIDDYRDLGVKIRLAIQSIVATVMMYSSEASISDLGNVFGFGAIELGYFGIVFTIVCVIACINAFNMIDGIDGLAGSLSIVTLFSVFILFLISGAKSFVQLPLIIVATVVPYLAFNLGIKGHRTKKIFMGDAGSMFIGLSVIWFLMMGTQGADLAFRPVTALWIIAVPLMDMIAIIIRRIKKGQSPFSADRDHLHHIFMRFGVSSRQALGIITLLGLLMSAIGILGEYYHVPEIVMLGLFVTCFLLYNWALIHCWKIARTIKRRKIQSLRKAKQKI